MNVSSSLTNARRHEALRKAELWTWMISPKTTWSTASSTFLYSGKKDDLWRSLVFPLKPTYWIPLQDIPALPRYLQTACFTRSFTPKPNAVHYISHTYRRCIYSYSLITFHGNRFSASRPHNACINRPSEPQCQSQILLREVVNYVCMRKHAITITVQKLNIILQRLICELSSEILWSLGEIPSGPGFKVHRFFTI